MLGEKCNLLISASNSEKLPKRVTPWLKGTQMKGYY